MLIGGSVPVHGWLKDYPMWTAQGTRYGIAGLLLLGWMRVRGLPLNPPRGQDLPALLGLALTGMLGFSMSQLLAQRYAEPGFVAAALGIIPLVLCLVGPVVAGTRPSPQVVAGAGLVVSGILVLSGGGAWYGPGLALVVVAVACETTFTLFAVGVVARLGGMAVSTWACLLAGGIGLVGGIGFGETAAWRMPEARELIALVVMAVLVTAVGFCLWYHGLALLGADRLGVLIGLMPVSGLVVSVLIGAQRLTIPSLIGVALVTAGCVVGLRRANAEDG